MIISDLKHVENISEATSVQGGWGTPLFTYYQNDFVGINFLTSNTFQTSVNSPKTYSNSASAGAKGEAINDSYLPSYSFTKADTIAVTELGGSSFSGSTSAAVINTVW